MQLNLFQTIVSLLLVVHIENLNDERPGELQLFNEVSRTYLYQF